MAWTRAAMTAKYQDLWTDEYLRGNCCCRLVSNRPPCCCQSLFTFTFCCVFSLGWCCRLYYFYFSMITCGGNSTTQAYSRWMWEELIKQMYSDFLNIWIQFVLSGLITVLQSLTCLHLVSYVTKAQSSSYHLTTDEPPWLWGSEWVCGFFFHASCRESAHDNNSWLFEVSWNLVMEARLLCTAGQEQKWLLNWKFLLWKTERRVWVDQLFFTQTQAPSQANTIF